MPITIACVYECDHCHKQVSGVTTRTPDGWNNGGRLARNIAKAAQNLAVGWGRIEGVAPYVFCSLDCSDAHEKKLEALGHK